MRPLANLSLAAALLFAPAAASAQVATPARDSIATISFSDPAFSDARLRIDATQTIGAGSSGTKNVTFDAAPSLEGYTLTSTGAVGVTLNSFTPPAGFDLTVGAAGAGSWSIAERFSASEDLFGPDLLPLYRHVGYNDSFVPFTNNTLPALELLLYVGGLVDTGGRFGVGFVIPGNWSTTGGLDSTSGQYFLAGLDPDWAIDTPFIYDAGAGVTRFHATNPRYEGASSEHPSPYLDVYFLGATVGGAVPEPASWALMIAGFGVVGGALRRRGAGHRVAAFA